MIRTYVIPLLAIVILLQVSKWYAAQQRGARGAAVRATRELSLSPRQVSTALGLLFVLAFSKYFYVASISNYFTFYLIETFGVSVHNSQLYLFVFLAAVAAGVVTLAVVRFGVAGAYPWVDPALSGIIASAVAFFGLLALRTRRAEALASADTQ